MTDDHATRLANLNTLLDDLATRWVPSPEQMRAADALLNAGFEGVLTPHILVNKRHGVWTADVRVIPVDGVFLTRAAALNACNNAARVIHETTGETVCGGYARHHAPGRASVFDDICSQFPDPTERII